MDINMDYSDDDNPLGVKSDFVLSLCELIMGSRDGIEAEEKSVIWWSPSCWHRFITVFLKVFMNLSVERCFSNRSFLRYSDRLIDKQAAPWSNKSSSTSVRRNPIKSLWFSSLSLFFVLILLLPLRLFLPPGVHVFQYRLSLPILEIVLWTPIGGTNRQVKCLLLRGYGETPSR